MNFVKNFKLTVLHKQKFGKTTITKENLTFINLFLKKNILLSNKITNNYYEYELNNNLVNRLLEIKTYPINSKFLIYNKKKIKKEFKYNNTLFVFKSNNGLYTQKNLIRNKQGGLLIMSLSF